VRSRRHYAAPREDVQEQNGNMSARTTHKMTITLGFVHILYLLLYTHTYAQIINFP
jgi:hypothetical protein